MRIRLPMLVHKGRRLLAGVLIFGAAAILYLTSNHFHIFTPRFCRCLALMWPCLLFLKPSGFT